VLERNPNYWRGPVKLERVIFRPIVEDQARLTELLTGSLDLMVGVPADYVAQLEQNPKVSVLKQVGAHVWYLGMNSQKKPFDDKRVRQALNYAVNKEAIVRDVLKDTGTPRRPCPPQDLAADPTLKPYPYDPARAKKLLAEAGFPNGFSPRCGAGVRLGMQSPSPCHGHAVHLKSRRRECNAPDDGVGRLPRQAALEEQTCSRCLGWRGRKTRIW